jgi:hypothetical protein
MFEKFKRPSPYDELVGFWKQQIPARQENGEGIVGDEWIEAFADSHGLSEEDQSKAYYQAKEELGLTD